MATPTKTSSGRWCIRVFSHKDAAGRIHQKRFYADTKKEVLQLAREFEYDRGRLSKDDLTVSEAILKYIEKKKSTASPSTITGYKTIYDTEFSEDVPDPSNWKLIRARKKRNIRIGMVRVNALTSEAVQDWINELKGILSPKSVKNAYGLFYAAVKDVRKIEFDVTLPQTVKPDIHVPTSADIKALLEATEGTELHTAISLAAFASLRRGEIAALRRSDIEDDKIHVRHSLSRTGNGESATWALKTPKTVSGQRTVPIPAFLVAEIETKSDRVCDLTPAEISTQFTKLTARLGMECSFHSLRHFWASFQHSAGTPDQMIIEWGGWSSDITLKKIYRHTLDDERRRVAERMNALMTDQFG